MDRPLLTISLADQSFARTKSIGILNLSVQLTEHLSRLLPSGALAVLGNTELNCSLKLDDSTRVRVYDSPTQGSVRRVLWDQLGAYRAARDLGSQWLLLPKGFASFVSRPPCRLACYVHDLMPEHYQRHHPAAVSKAENAYFRTCLRASLKQSKIIFTNSQFTAEELRRFAEEHQITPPNIMPVGIGFHPPVRKPATRDRILVLISRWPHKRTGMVVDDVQRWCARAEFKGAVDWVGALPEGVTINMQSGWTHAERMDEASFRKRMSQTCVLVYASEYEGFGMPPVEAVLAGACPVYSDIPAMREVMAGRGCAFSNESFESLASAMDTAMKTPSESIECWARELSALYDWKLVAARVAACLTADRQV